jgi:hypothetical protein
MWRSPLSKVFSGVSGKLVEAEQNLGEIVAQMHNLGDRLAQVEVPQDLLAQKLTPLTRSLTNNAKKIDQATALMGAGIEKLNVNLSTMDANATKLGETMLRLITVHMRVRRARRGRISQQQQAPCAS